MAENKPTPNQKRRHERERRAWSQQDVADKVFIVVAYDGAVDQTQAQVRTAVEGRCKRELVRYLDALTPRRYHRHLLQSYRLRLAQQSHIIR
jgi:hypothetical protein